MTSKKILYIINTPQFFLSHRLPIALEAKKKGYEVHVASAFDEFAVDTIKNYGFNYHSLSLSRSGKNPIKELSTFISIFLLLRKVKPEILHLVTIKPVLYGGIASRLFPIQKVVCAISGLGSAFISSSKSTTKKLVTFLYKIALGKNRKNLHVIFQNNDDMNVLVNLKAIDIKQAIIIRGSGADLTLYKFIPEDSRDKLIVTFAARLLFDKGIQEFISAAKIILEKKEHLVEFRIIGDLDTGNPSTISQEDINRWNQIEGITFKGFQKNMAYELSHSNIVVLPSYREGLPKVLIEAAACGRAVITTDVPGCRDAIIENKTGLLVPVKNAQALAEAIQNLLESQDKRRDMGLAGRALAESTFDINLIVKQHMDIYNGVTE